MANVGTSTVAYATQQPTGSLVFVASDGTACVLWNDGTNQKFSYASPPYSSWTTTTLVTGLNMALGGRFRAGTDNIDVVSGGSANVRGNYFPLTKIGATYSLGTSNVITGTTAIGTTAVGNVMQYAGQDPQGRHWIVVGGASTYTAETGYFSPANSPTSTGWTASPTSAVAQTGDVNLPAGDQIGNYILRIWWNGTALQYSRADNSAASVGAWATAATIPNLTGSPNGSSRVVFRAISSTQALLAYSTGSGIYAQTYNPSTNTFSAATQLSTNASDRHPAIATDNAGNAWVFWCSFAAANSYALVYKKWNGTSWATSATTLIASGTNIANPSANYGSGTLGVMYTVGTANPFTVGWATVSIPILNQTRTVPASAALLQTVTGHLPYPTVIKSHAQLLAYWRMGEASGSSAADASGNGKTAALSGVTAYSSSGAIARDSDTSLAFTAAGGLTFPSSLNITAMTTLGLEFWIELAGVWEYVGVDYDGTTTTVYRNGAPYTPDASAPVGIDQGFYWAGAGAAGNLDEVAVYARLTQAMATADYQAGSVPFLAVPASAALLATKTRTIPTILQLSVSSAGKIVDTAGNVIHLRGLNTAGLEFGDGVGAFTQARINAFARLFSMNLWRLAVNVSWWNNNVLMPDGTTHYKAWVQTVIGWMRGTGCYVEIDPTTYVTIPPTNSGPFCDALGNPPYSTSDMFNRGNVSNSWGTASSGLSWSQKSGLGTYLSIVSNEGVITANSNFVDIILGTETIADTEGLVRLAITGSNPFGGILLRYTDENNYYAANINAGRTWLDKVVGGVDTTLANPVVTHTLGSFYWMRFNVTGTTLKVKTWPDDGSAEPGTWDITVTDSALASGLMGLTATSGGTADSTQFDSFTAGTPVTSCITGQSTLNNPPWTDAQKLTAATTFFQDFIPRYQNDPAILYDALNEPASFLDEYGALNTMISVIQAAQPNALVFVYAGPIDSIIAGTYADYTQPNLVWDFHIYDDSPGAPWQNKIGATSTNQVTRWPYIVAHHQAITIGEWNTGATNDPNGFGETIANLSSAQGIANTYYYEGNLLQGDNVTLTAQGVITQAAFQIIASGSTGRIVPTTVVLSVPSVRTIPASSALVGIGARTLPSSAALIITKTRMIGASTALTATLTRTAGATLATSATSTRTVPASVALLSSPTRTTAGSAALTGALTRSISASAALLLTRTRTISTSAALGMTSTRQASSTVALLATSTRTIPTSGAVQSQASRSVPASSALSITRTVPTSVALSLTQVRTIPASSALSLTQARQVGASVALLATIMRTVFATGVLQGQATRSIPSTGALSITRIVPGSAALQATNTRTVSSSVALLSTRTRTLPSSAALLASFSRSIGASAALLSTRTRTITTDAALSLIGTATRTIPATTALLATVSRSVGASVALGLSNVSRTVPATTALLRQANRSIPASTPLQATGSRQVAASAALLTSSSRTVPVTAALMQQSNRVIPASTPLQATGSRQVPSSAALVSQASRSIPATSALVATLTRSSGATVALIATFSRMLGTSAALTIPGVKFRDVPCSASLSGGSRVIPATVALRGTQTRSIPCTASISLPVQGLQIGIPASAALSSTSTRFVLCTVALLASNASLRFRSGVADIRVRSGTVNIIVS